VRFCEFVAEKLGVAKSRVRIVAGETSHLKRNTHRRLSIEDRQAGVAGISATAPYGRGSVTGFAM